LAHSLLYVIKPAERALHYCKGSALTVQTPCTAPSPTLRTIHGGEVLFPLLSFPPIANIGTIQHRNFVNLGPSSGSSGLDQGIIIGSLAGSTLVSLVMTVVSHWIHTPHHCLSIPSVIPMVPGVLMYRALFAFIDMHGVVGEVTVGMHNLILASLAILCIAIGIAIPNIFIRSMLESKRKLRIYQLLVERRRVNGC